MRAVHSGCYDVVAYKTEGVIPTSPFYSLVDVV